jgi:hypothetical protein
MRYNPWQVSLVCFGAFLVAYTLALVLSGPTQ